MKFRLVAKHDTAVKVFRPSSITHNMTNHITEEDGVMIAEWCKQNNCGRRTSFNLFEFRDKEEVTMFMLRWS